MTGRSFNRLLLFFWFPAVCVFPFFLIGRLSVDMFVRLSFCLSFLVVCVFLFVSFCSCACVFSFVCLFVFVCLFDCSSVRLSVCLCVCLFVCVLMCLFVWVFV